MIHELSITTAFLLGLLGSGHCIGMCGGIMSALSIGSGTSRNPGIILGYNIGRILSYATIGLLMGTLGWFLGEFSRETSIILRIIAGFMLIAMGLYLAGWWSGLTVLERAGHKLWQYIQPRASSMLPVTSPLHAVIVGAVWGWLPCGLVYSTLTWAAASGSVTESALLMLFFGLGTLPVLFITGLLARKVQTLLQGHVFRSVAGTLVILFGLWTLPGPHQMWLMNAFKTEAGHVHSADKVIIND